MKTITTDEVFPQVVAIHSEFVRIAGARCGLFLSQLFNWSDDRFHNWIRKSAADWEAETGLTSADINHAYKRAQKLGLIEVAGNGKAFRVNGQAVALVLSIPN